MGSTGHGVINKSRQGNVNNETFGIPNAFNFTGKVPKDSGLEPVGNNKVTLRMRSDEPRDILFQFKLLSDGKMKITAFDPNQPSKGKVSVSSKSPSLDAVMKDGSKSDKRNALAIKDMMARSSKIDESQLGSIAQKLIRNKTMRGK